MMHAVALLIGVMFLLGALSDPDRSRRAPARGSRSRPRTGRAAVRDSRAMVTSTARAWRAATPAGRRWRTRTLAGNAARMLLWPDRRAPVRAAPRGPRVNLVHPARTRAPLAHPPRTPAQRSRTAGPGGPHMELVRRALATADAGQMDPPEGGLPGVPEQARAWAAAIEAIADGYLAWVGSLVEDVGLAPKPLEPLLDAGDVLVGLGPAVAAGAQQIAAGRR